MKKQGNCDQCHKKHELSNEIVSTFHRHFKHRNMKIKLVGMLYNMDNMCMDYNMFLCKKCKLEVMRAMKNGDNWE